MHMQEIRSQALGTNSEYDNKFKYPEYAIS